MPYFGRAPTGTGAANKIEGDLKVTGTISGESINSKFGLDATDGSKSNINDHFTIEDGGTDGSGTNAGDDLLLEETTSGEAEGFPGLASSTSGQIFTSAGAGSTPTFSAATEAGWTFVEKVTASGASTVDIGDSTNVVAGFDYIIRCDDMDTSADQTNTLGLRFGTGSGTPSYQNATYNSQEHQTVASSNTVSNVAGASELRFALTNINIGGAGAGETQTLEITIYNPNENQKTRASGIIFGDNSGNVMYNSSFTGERDVSEVVTSFQIVLSGGTVSGNFILCKRAIA